MASANTFLSPITSPLYFHFSPITTVGSSQSTPSPPSISPLAKPSKPHPFSTSFSSSHSKTFSKPAPPLPPSPTSSSSADTRLSNTLIINHLRLGRLDDARRVFDLLPSPDVASYSAMISGYAKSHRHPEAAALFFQMRLSGIDPNHFALVAILTLCLRTFDLQFTSQIHSLATKTCHLSSVFVSNALMGAYLKCGDLDSAAQVFDEIPHRDSASWNTVISGLAQNSQFDQAFAVFRDMQICGFRGNRFSLSSLLAAAREIRAWAEGREIHGHAIRIGLDSNLSVSNALIGFYAKCGSVTDMVGLFERMTTRDAITWATMITGFMEFGLVESAVGAFDQMPERNSAACNALLAGFCQNGEGERALELFRQMVQDGMELTDFTLTSAVNSCAIVSDFKRSKEIHGFVIKVGHESNAWVEVALLDMCAKCGRLTDAQKMLDRWTHGHGRLVVWTSLICGYAQSGQPEEALSLFLKLQIEEDVAIDEFALATLLGVFGSLGFENNGKQIHSLIVKCRSLYDLALGNAIVTMYSKCGNMNDAVKTFYRMPEHDIVSWNSLISVYLLQRQGDTALSVWANMLKVGVKLDEVSLISVLLSCKYTRSNSADTCRCLFHSMRSGYLMEPTSQHYAAMVDVLGYWGCFEEAESLIRNMPFEPDSSHWRALLDSCRLRSNIVVGKRAVQSLLALEPQDPSTYILVSNLYSASGRWHCSERVREEMKEKGLCKHPVRSWVIHQDAVHSFYARDKLHPQAKDIYRGLDILILECMKLGYLPDTSFVLHEVEEYQKKDFLFYHSAKLAATFGILMTTPGRIVRVMKNVHLCGDCHAFLKYASVATGREILLRDASGFHCFKGGKCSCGDYW